MISCIESRLETLRELNPSITEAELLCVRHRLQRRRWMVPCRKALEISLVVGLLMLIGAVM